MHTTRFIKTLGLLVGLGSGLAAATAHAGIYSNATASQMDFETINGVPYMCFMVLAPASAKYQWCMPTSNPAAMGMSQIVMDAYDRNLRITMGCNACQSIPGDANDQGTKWIPEFVYETATSRCVTCQ